MRKALSPRGAHLLLCLAMALVSCGKDDNGSSNPTPAAPAPPPAQSQSAVLQGSWRTACRGRETLGASSAISGAFSGENVLRSLTIYDDPNCKAPAAIIEENGKFTTGASVRDDIYAIDFAIKSVRAEPLSPNGADTLNTIAFCGIRDWKAGVSRDITPMSADCWTETPRSNYDIYQRNGNTLTFGDYDEAHDGTAPDKRPTELSQEAILTRQ